MDPCENLNHKSLFLALIFPIHYLQPFCCPLCRAGPTHSFRFSCLVVGNFSLSQSHTLVKFLCRRIRITSCILHVGQRGLNHSLSIKAKCQGTQTHRALGWITTKSLRIRAASWIAHGLLYFSYLGNLSQFTQDTCGSTYCRLCSHVSNATRFSYSKCQSSEHGNYFYKPWRHHEHRSRRSCNWCLCI